MALAGHVGGKLLGVLERPFMVQNLPIEVGASVGIAAAPEHGQEAEVLLRRADLAMQVAKRLASGCVVYSPELRPLRPRAASPCSASCGGPSRRISSFSSTSRRWT